MAVTILDISKVFPKTYSYYFFDANCWVTQLLYTSGTLNQVQRNQPQKYVNFFSSVITAATSHGNKPTANKPKIIVTSLLISEIFNAYMHLKHSVYQKVNPNCKKFKKDYRPTTDYEKQTKTLISDFEAFKDYVLIESDYVKEIDPFTLFQSVSSTNDFNDVFLYFQLREIKRNINPIAIVTDDSDFVFEGIDIITANTTLLGLNKNKNSSHKK
ncbi:MAG: hypothetical protein HYZ44_03535 [Bacteroidetes bacterium]|nr:hypothetical protein [Bacteroidota bacterium]